MAYNSAHTGPEIDAAVQLLGDIQEAKNSTAADRQAVTGMAATVATQAAQVSAQAAQVSSNTSAVLASASAVEADRAEVEQNTGVVLSAKTAAQDAGAAAVAAQGAVEAIQESVSQSQIAAEYSEQSAGDSASAARADRVQVELLAQQTAEDSASAAESAAAASAVVTGGTATLNPEPGKIPLSKGDGKIDEGWLPDGIARINSVAAVAEQAEIAIATAESAEARIARYLEPAATPPELRDDGLPLQIGDVYFNTVGQTEYIFKSAGWRSNDSIQAVDALEQSLSGPEGALQIGFESETVDSALLNAKTLAGYASLRNYGGRSTSVRINYSGIAGLFLLDETDSISQDNGGTILVGIGGRRWKRAFTGAADVRWFGASESLADNAAPLNMAVASGLPLLLSGHFKAKSKIYGVGSLLVVGLGRDKSSITWSSDSASIGWEQSPTNISQQILLEDFELISAAPLTGVMFYSSWAGLTGYTTLTYFSYKFIAKRVVIRQSGVGSFTKGVELRNIYGGVLEHCHIYGVPPVGPRTPDIYQTTHLVHISNDGSASNTVGIKMFNNHLYHGRYGVYAEDLEGFEYGNNDIQVCWDGVTINNVIRKVNQYRVTSNHMGCDNSAFVASNARSVMLQGNEFSWGSNRANGATFSYISFINVEDLAVTDNTIRGNGAVGTYGHTITGVRVDGTPEGLSVYGLIDNNRFRDLSVAVAQEVNTTRLQYGISNQFNNVPARFVNNKGGSAQQQLMYGTGPLSNPTGVSPLMLLTAVGSSQLGLNRDAPGSMQTFHIAGGSAVGVISSSATATTYGTSSDMNLKDDEGEMPVEDAMRIMEAISIHRYKWMINGDDDVGVFAQELHEVYPKAVIKGGWKTLDGADGVEGDEGVHYQAWAVDYSKLVVPIARCLQGLIGRITAIESLGDK